MSRIDSLCALIDKCESFADVGCDHGFCTQYALKNGLCKIAYVSDISAKSLSKAQMLLKEYVSSGVCRPVCCDGLSLIPEDIDEVLIAGMGGIEIVKILSHGFIPKKFILQPMRNMPLVRSFLIERGCKITYDGIFYDEKYYFVIKGEREGATSAYSSAELQFGRDSLNDKTFLEYARGELEKKLSYVGAVSPEITKEIQLLKEVLK